MTRIDEATIAQSILRAPGWARVGITAPNERLRDEAACELARAILDGLSEVSGETADTNQLKLAL